ncbi:hypothetical protein WT24_05870 [Burkholderia sp. MSMB1078WGS]|nr:hypothetical protein WT24_05870 [Burkholderia sp. MSMB1078WGS]
MTNLGKLQKPVFGSGILPWRRLIGDIAPYQNDVDANAVVAQFCKILFETKSKRFVGIHVRRQTNRRLKVNVGDV